MQLPDHSHRDLPQAQEDSGVQQRLTSITSEKAGDNLGTLQRCHKLYDPSVFEKARKATAPPNKNTGTQYAHAPSNERAQKVSCQTRLAGGY